ncbi:MAG: Crp/Fnr family transcriptional regulator [Oscillospiraceae bacterium]|nr:Crp/Fnr family transcriptional regulator [Oscillospiraceae bacterium]
MENYTEILKNTNLFSDITRSEVESMLHCLQAKIQSFEKGQYIFRQGEKAGYIAILLDGRVHIQNDDYWGNRTIVNIIEAGNIFGDMFSPDESDVSCNDAVAVEACTVVLLESWRILTPCSLACRHHAQVIHNLFLLISAKNRQLVQKLDHLSKRSTRQKLMSYLSSESKRQKSNTFSISLNRQQLADFLSVDRSAMSNELCKLRDEGYISFNRNNFTLH